MADIALSQTGKESWPQFTTFPQTKPPPQFVFEVVQAFTGHESCVSTLSLPRHKESNQVLQIIGPSLQSIGFQVELTKTDRISRPVFFGAMGKPRVYYEIDGYHSGWRCGLEIEAGRALGGNAVFRDLFQAMVMTDVDHLILAVALCYRRKSGGRSVKFEDYRKTVSIAEALYGHDRIRMPYGLTVLGY